MFFSNRFNINLIAKKEIAISKGQVRSHIICVIMGIKGFRGFWISDVRCQMSEVGSRKSEAVAKRKWRFAPSGVSNQLI